MSDYNKPLPIPSVESDSKPEDFVGRQQQDRTVNVSCSQSYTPSNAQKWQDTFDAMIATQKNRVVTQAQTGLKVNTLYQNANFALKWLMDNSATLNDRAKYAALRSQVKIRRYTDRIEIYFKPTLPNMSTIQSIPSADISTVTGWKEQFEAWLPTAQPGEIFERTGIVVTVEQAQMLIKTMAQLGEDCEVEVGPKMESVRVMR